MPMIPLTVKGAELLKAELHQLKSVQRPAVINSISEARAQGDLSENAEYDAAKERQSFIEGRIAELESKLSNAQIIDPTLLDADGRCVFGATVELQDMGSDEKVTYQITRSKSTYAFANVAQVIKQSNLRVTPKCPHYGLCGGCKLQHLDFSGQVAAKQPIRRRQPRRHSPQASKEGCVRAASSPRRHSPALMQVAQSGTLR